MEGGTSRVRHLLVAKPVRTDALRCVVPGAGLEPATFGCLRHRKGFARHTIAL